MKYPPPVNNHVNLSITSRHCLGRDVWPNVSLFASPVAEGRGLLQPNLHLLPLHPYTPRQQHLEQAPRRPLHRLLPPLQVIARLRPLIVLVFISAACFHFGLEGGDVAVGFEGGNVVDDRPTVIKRRCWVLLFLSFCRRTIAGSRV